jgi:hypothetical protein
MHVFLNRVFFSAEPGVVSYFQKQIRLKGVLDVLMHAPPGYFVYLHGFYLMLASYIWITCSI